MNTKGPCLVQSTELSAKLELGSVVSPVVGHPVWCSIQAGTVRTEMLKQGRWHVEAVWNVDSGLGPLWLILQSPLRAMPPWSSLYDFPYV